MQYRSKYNNDEIGGKSSNLCCKNVEEALATYEINPPIITKQIRPRGGRRVVHLLHASFALRLRQPTTTTTVKAAANTIRRLYASDGINWAIQSGRILQKKRANSTSINIHIGYQNIEAEHTCTEISSIQALIRQIVSDYDVEIVVTTCACVLFLAKDGRMVLLCQISCQGESGKKNSPAALMERGVSSKSVSLLLLHIKLFYQKMQLMETNTNNSSDEWTIREKLTFVSYLEKTGNYDW